MDFIHELMSIRISQNKFTTGNLGMCRVPQSAYHCCKYEGWNFNSGNYLFTTDTK